MAKSFLPDPLELLRQVVNRLDGRASEVDPVIKTVQQMSGLSLVLRQAVEMAIANAYKRLKLPSSRDFAEVQATLQRLEDKLDRLLAAQAAAAPRARKPAAAAPAAKETKPRRTTAQSRRRTTP
jgi:hypothetical protein